MCKGGEKNQLSVGNQKWSMKLMKAQCHRLIQLSFQFPWQRNVIVPAIFSAEKKIFSEIVTNLGEGALHPDQECSVDGKE